MSGCGTDARVGPQAQRPAAGQRVVDGVVDIGAIAGFGDARESGEQSCPVGVCQWGIRLAVGDAVKADLQQQGVCVLLCSVSAGRHAAQLRPGRRVEQAHDALLRPRGRAMPSASVSSASSA